MGDAMDVAVDIDDIPTQSTNRQKKGRGFESPETRENGGGFETIDTEKEEARGNHQKSVEGWIIFVTNLHEETSEEDVQDKFAEYGEIHNMNLNLDRRTGFVKGYALIEYKDYTTAKAAIDDANGSEMLGKIISCQFAFSRNAIGQNGSKELR